MAYASLSIDLKAQLANLQSGMDKAVRLAEKDAARIEKAFGAAKIVAGTIGGALAAGLGGATLSAFIIQTNDALLAIKDLAEGTGSTVENVSALENALRLNNRQLSEAQPILVKFNGALKEADGKNGISQALQAIGVSADELRRQDPVEALRTVAVALQGFNDDGNKARIVQELFGKSVAEVIPLLNDLADTQFEATKGIREATEQADKFEKNLARLTTNATDAGRALAGPLVAGLNATFEALKKFGERLDIGGTIAANAGAQRDLALAVRKMEGLQGLIDREGSTPERASLMERLRADAAAATAELQRTSGALKGLAAQADATDGKTTGDYSNEGRNARRSLPSLTGNPTRTTPRAVRAEAGPFVGPELPQALRDALRAIEQTDVAKVRELKAQLQELMSLRAAGGDSPALAESITDISLALDELNAKSFKPAVDIKSDFLRSEKAGYEETDELMRKLQDDSKKLDGIANDLGLTFSSAFEDAIVGGKGLREVLQGLEQDILRIITRKLVTEPLGNAITGLLGGGKDGGGIDFGGLLGKIGSGLGDLFGGFFADGGFLPPGRWGIAGERGPEPIFGGRTGMTVQPAGGGGRSITVNVSMPAGADRRTGQQFGADIARAINRASARNG